MNRNWVALVVLSLSYPAGCAEPDELLLGDLEEPTDAAADGGSGDASCARGSGGARADAEGDAGEAVTVSSAAATAQGGRGAELETGDGGNSADENSPIAGTAGLVVTSLQGGSSGSDASSHSGGSDATGGSEASGFTGGREPSGSTGGSGGAVSTGGSEASGSTGGRETSGSTGGSGDSESTGGSAGLPEPVTHPVSLEVQAQAYVLSGDWAGYAWIAAENATVTPTDFGDHAAGEPLCITGSVAASPEYSGLAGLGINLNQAADGATPAGWDVTSEGLSYQIRNPMSSELRLHLLGAAGGNWCVWLPSESGTFAWRDFRTECWSNEGTVFDGSEPIESILLLVPGLAVVDVPFEVCLEELASTDQVPEQPATPDVCADAVGAGSGELLTGFEVAPGGYVTGQEIHGWAYVASETSSVGTSVAPADFTAHPGGAPLCISGTVGASPDYSGFAVVGINLNQGDEAEAEVGLVSLSGVGLAYDISNCGGSPLRIELLGEAGMADSEERWCVNVTSGQGFVFWSEFNTACWDESGTAYDGVTPLSVAEVLVPGDAERATPFDFCLNGLN